MYAEVPLALSTTFFLLGAGTFMVLAVVMRLLRLEQKHLRNIDTLSLMPSLAVVLGLVAALFGFQDQTNAVVLLRSVASDPVRFTALGVSGLFALVVVVYWAWANFGQLTGDCRKRLLSVAGTLGLMFVCVLGFTHMMVLDSSWGTFATFVQMLGFALLGGSALVVMMLEKADALSDSLVKRALSISSLFGAVLGIGGFAVQLAIVLSSGEVRAAQLVLEASSQIVVSFFCLAAVLIFEMMAIRMKETGFHAVIALACAFVGVFCARLVFYAL